MEPSTLRLKLTVQQLQDVGACPEGIKVFQAFFKGDEAKCEWTVAKQIEMLKSPLRIYFGWAVQKKLLPLWSFDSEDLSRADLYGADLYGADLYGADLSGADLYAIQGVAAEELAELTKQAAA